MRLLPPRSPRTADPMLPMINVVFLLLVFFLIAATLEPPDPVAVTPPAAEAGDPGAPEPALVLTAAGETAFRGLTGDAAEAAALAEGVRLVRADREAPARALAALLARLKAGGAEGLRLATLPGAP